MTETQHKELLFPLLYYPTFEGWSLSLDHNFGSQPKYFGKLAKLSPKNQ